jgi:hypothetical protein
MKRSLLIPFPSILLIALLSAQATLATSVTPIKYGKWRQNQVVPFMWKADARPPAWLRPAILDATADSGSSRRSQAAVFDLDDSATSWIGYTNDVCTEGAIGCAMNNAPNYFTLRIRPQGWVFDWGTLRWCLFCPVSPSAVPLIRSPSAICQGSSTARILAPMLTGWVDRILGALYRRGRSA